MSRGAHASSSSSPPAARPTHTNISFQQSELQLTLNYCPRQASCLHSTGWLVEAWWRECFLAGSRMNRQILLALCQSLEQHLAGPNLWKYGWLSTSDPLVPCVRDEGPDKHTEESLCNKLTAYQLY